jgi:hypothetical protein
MEQTTRRDLLTKQLHRLVFAGVLSVLLTSIAAAASDDNNTVRSGPDDWIQMGASTSSDWSREALLNQILGRSKIETREQVIALLGPPNYTLDRYNAGYASQIVSTLIVCRQRTTGHTTSPSNRRAKSSTRESRIGPAVARTARKLPRWPAQL